MPPKPKLKKEEIVETAFAHVRRQGWQGLTARFLAEQLGTSTKPIYFHFKSMFDIETMVVKKAMGVVQQYALTERSGDPWIDQAVGIVLFALEEKYLFRAIFDEKHVAVRRKYSTRVWEAAQAGLSGHTRFGNLTAEQVESIRRVRWIFTHGLASLMNIANWPWQEGGEALLIRMIERISHAVYQEFKDDTEVIFSEEYARKILEEGDG